MRFFKLAFGWLLIVIGVLSALISIIGFFIDDNKGIAIAMFFVWGVLPFLFGYLIIKKIKDRSKANPRSKKKPPIILAQVDREKEKLQRIKAKEDKKRIKLEQKKNIRYQKEAEKRLRLFKAEEAHKEAVGADKILLKIAASDPRFVPKEENFSFAPQYHIKYIDAQGMLSDRDITIINYDKWRLYAYCHLRNAERTFTIDNIREAVDLNSGEVVDFKIIDI